MKTLHTLVLTFFLLLPTSGFASIMSMGDLFGGGSSGGGSSAPTELIVNGETKTDQSPTKQYSFYSSVNQNITVHITNHGDTTSGWGSSVNRDLNLTLHNLASDGTCDTSTTLATKKEDGNFDWTQSTTGGKLYCLQVDGESTTGGIGGTNRNYDINLTSDASLKLGISDASANESDGTINFIVALTKASSSDTTVNYTFTDGTAKNGENYNGTNGSVTIPAGQDSATITANLIDTNMSTTKDFTVTISSSSVSIDDANATGTINGSSTVSSGDGDNYNGPDICYDSRETSGMCMFGSCMFYKETTNVHSMVDGLTGVNVKKSLTRGIAFMDFASGIGIDDTSKTMQTGDDQAEKKEFASADFLGSSFFNASMFPKGLEYRIGKNANSSQGGNLGKDNTTSYYDKSLFKFGLFTQYTQVVTYTKNGTQYQEVLQACNPDVAGSLTAKPTISQCGIFLDALNSATKITFDTSAEINNTTDSTLNTPIIQDTNNTALCGGQVCQADGVGSTSITLPIFRDSTETTNTNIPYSMVIAEQQIGSLTTTTDAKTESSESNRTIVFEAPYSQSYGSRVMFIHSITDHDAHASTYHYVFKEGDYWINSWDINKAKNVTIETVGNVRFFINNDFTITNTGALNIGHSGAATSSKFYMYIYGDFTTNVAGATAIQNGYIYTRGALTLGSTSTIALDWGALTANGELKISNGASSTFNYSADTNSADDTLFGECSEGSSTYITGPFDAWDTSISGTNPPQPSDRNITTKVVNSAFQLSLASLNKDSDGYEVKSGAGVVDVAIYPRNSNTAISNSIAFNVTTDSNLSQTPDITVTSASRDAVVGFKLCATYEDNTSTAEDDTKYILYNSSECSSSTVLNDCNATTTGTPTWHVCHSTDNFAIRPYAFKVFGGDGYARAGEDFNLSIRAVDLANFNKNSGTSSTVLGTPNYSVVFSDLTLTSNFYTPTTSQLDIMYKNVMDTNITASPAIEKARVATCSTAGIFTKLNTTDTFLDGNLTAKLKFSETGILTIDVNETLGHEFAIVDADDTPIAQRFILGSSKIYSKTNIAHESLLLVNPYSIDTTAEYNTSTAKAWIYMDDISDAATSHTKPNMSAYLHYTVTAKNKDGAITKNFSSTCFPDVTETWPTPSATDCPRVNGLKLNTTYDFKLAATINSTADVNISIYNGDKNENALYIDAADQDANLSVGNNSVRKATMYPKQFTNGVAESYVHFNVDRNSTTALNPVTLKVVDANSWLGWSSSASPAAFNGTTLNQSYNFLYGRAHAPKQRYSVPEDAPYTADIYYEVYCYGTGCDKTLLPSTEHNDDIRWYKNTTHTTGNDGNVSAVTEKGSIGKVTPDSLSNTANPTTVNLPYDGSYGYPYTTTMELNASKWLIYKEDGTANSFQTEYNKASTGWSGKHETNAETNTTGSAKTNRRTMW